MSFPLIDDFLNLSGIHKRFTNPSFPYKPLNASTSEIRLVELHPSDWCDNVEVSLFHASLDENPTYEALSYTWGDTSITRRILVNEQEFRVTENLEIGLRHLRAFDRKVLWIDAICINQDDLEERAQQVSRMNSIYDQASRVVVWLGSEADDSDIAMLRMRQFKERHKWHLPTLRNYISWDDAELIGDADHPESVRAWKAIARLYSRPWFSRAWVVQEASGSKNLCIICGTQSADYVAFTVTFQIVQELLERPNCSSHPGYRVMEEVRSAVDNWSRISMFKGLRLENKPEVNNILWLLETFRHFDATDPRDKVYATLSFQTDIPSLKADYTLSLHQVYAGLVESYIKNKKNLDMLGHCRTTDALRSDMSCWVPYWGSPNDRIPFTKNADGKRVYSASGNTHPEARLSEDLSVLTLKGFHVDTIVEVAPSHRDTQTNHDLIKTHFSILGSLPKLTNSESDPFHYRHTNEPLLEAYSRTIVADFSAGFSYGAPHAEKMKELASSTGATYETVEGLDEVKSRPHRGFAMRWKTGPAEGVLNKEGYRMIAEEKDRLWSLRAATSTRRFFLSAKGYIGLVPEEARVGDLICILNGGAVLYVVWQSPNEKENRHLYQFIGEAYVHGIMDGEAMRELENGQIVSQEISLI